MPKEIKKTIPKDIHIIRFWEENNETKFQQVDETEIDLSINEGVYIMSNIMIRDKVCKDDVRLANLQTKNKEPEEVILVHQKHRNFAEFKKVLGK